MICPKCQVSLTVSKRFSINVNDCPQCHGIWLEQNALEKIIQQTQSIETSELQQENNEIVEEELKQVPHNKKRGTRQFLSGALNIYDDW
jgi:Zn-finger nucleic acid-binding protein